MRYVILAILLSLAWPAHAQEPESYKIFLPMVHGMAKCKETWRIVKPDGTTNKVLNPSAETTGNFSAIAGTTVTRVTTDSFVGLQSYRVQSNNNNEGMTLTLEVLANATHFVTLRVAGSLPPAWDWSLDNVNYRAPVLIESIDGDWDLYGLSFPAAQANGSTTLYIRQNGAGVGDFFIDGVQVEAKTYWTTYCDGTQEGCKWNGAAHTVASTRSDQSRAGGRVLNLQSDFGFFVEEVVGVGAAPETISTRSYAILPGGELSGSKTESRNFTLIGRFIADSEEDLHAKRQELIEELGINTYPESQAIRIRFSGAQVQKQISAHYTGGLEAQLKVSYGPWQVEGEDSWRKLTHWTERLTIQFLAPDPMWFEIGESSVLLNTNDSDTFRFVAGRLTDAGQWDNLGPPGVGGTYVRVIDIAEDAEFVYFGGDFDNFDGIANADNIVRLNKTTGAYSALGTGMDNVVFSLLIGPDGRLYAGGSFTIAGGGGANRIAVWDGAAWAALGVGVDSDVLDMEFGPTGLLYVVGLFLNAGGAGANRIASWDGAAWAALGAGLDSVVNAVAVSRSNIVFVGGAFLNAGGNPANRVAQFDVATTTWAAMGDGANQIVLALVLDTITNLLYIGGNFTSPGSFITVWNGTGFFSLGSGMDNAVIRLSLAPDGTLFAAGPFAEAGGITIASNLAKWNGASWAHVDIILPGAAASVIVYASKLVDPVVARRFDIYLGWDTAGTGNFGAVATATNTGAQPAFLEFFVSRAGGTSAVLETLRNETLGFELLFNYGLLDGETLTVNLKPTAKSIVSSFFGPVLDAVFANSDFGIWSLQPNGNDITSFVDVAGGPTVTAWLLWKDTYRSLD